MYLGKFGIRLITTFLSSALAISALPASSQANFKPDLPAQTALTLLQRFCLPIVLTGSALPADGRKALANSGFKPVDDLLTRGTAFNRTIGDNKILIDHLDTEKNQCRIRLGSEVVTRVSVANVKLFEDSVKSVLSREGFLQTDVFTTGPIQTVTYEGRLNDIAVKFRFVGSGNGGSGVSIYVDQSKD